MSPLLLVTCNQLFYQFFIAIAFLDSKGYFIKFDAVELVITGGYEYDSVIRYVQEAVHFLPVQKE